MLYNKIIVKRLQKLKKVVMILSKIFQVIKESVLNAFSIELPDVTVTKYQVETATKNYIQSAFKTLILISLLFIISQLYYLISDAIGGNFTSNALFDEKYIFDLVGEVLLLGISIITLTIVSITIATEKEDKYSFENKVIALYYFAVTIGCSLYVIAKILRCGGFVNTHSSIIYIILMLAVSPSHSMKVNYTCIFMLTLAILIPGIMVLSNPDMVVHQQYLFVDEIKSSAWLINNVIFLILGALVALYSRATTMRSKLKSVVLQDRNQELKQRTETDELTQVSNRLAMKRYIESKEDEWRKELDGVAFLMLDIDFFKKYNDFYGHLRGDECLRRVAQAANLAAQQFNGTVYRYGGEEFVIIAEHMDETQALALTKEVHREIGKLKIPHEGINGNPETMLTVSIGLNLEKSFKRASSQWILDSDLQLYYAKHEGRNCTAFRNGLYNTYHKPAAGEEAKLESH